MTTAARWARAEWGRLYDTVRAGLAERRAGAVAMTLGAVALTAALQVAQQWPAGLRGVRDLGAVRAEDPLWLALLRTPPSLFVPAPDLPVWGALVQVLLVFGIAEICLGRWRTLAVAYAATLAGTLYARVGIALGPGHPLGLPTSDARVVDTGPSAAVVGLAVVVALRYGARVTAGAVALAMVAEVLVKENLAGREHLAAIAAVLVLYALCGARRRYARPGARRRHTPCGARQRPRSSGAGSGAGSGLPPSQSSSARRGRAQRRSWR
ncbi:hypothetical protein OHA09_25710 [Streptomyces longwoodensis]|uniref:hypothetical protein n=1 Tax=Streptomyces longwoodensis TaxID=68231 RepID=UPI002E80AA2D|nr:hypothetical protein [Streptomyces longwoodensis]WUC60233.1 hypothetical protein OHA09_25710 [Streptomyces longwoodensis]